MQWDAKVFLDRDGKWTQLVINMTGEVVFQVQGSKYAVKYAWQEYADKHGLVVLREFNGKVKYTGKGAK